LKLVRSDEVVEIATSGQAGIDLVKQSFRQTARGTTCDFNLILTDCSMPFMDGFQCTQIIRDLLKEAGVEERP